MSSVPPLSRSSSSPSAAPRASARRRYAMVGCGARSQMYQDALQGKYREWSDLVGVCDRNAGRLEMAAQRSIRNGVAAPKLYAPENFELMIAELRPEIVLVMTMDASHHDYIIRAMEAGCDVVTEKPMTTTSESCQKIIDAKRRTGRSCRVTFNYRYSPPRSQVKDLLMSGVIGDLISVDFHWLLDTIHGADYFRRWHSDKRNSGGLMVHKATHHFDLVNWWLSAVPTSVYATGRREFYTPAMAKRMGLSGAHERCHTCPEKDKCTFVLDIEKDPSLRALYFDQEKYDGYFRDRCVWRPEVGIEDTMSVFVRYNTGASLTYSLCTYNAWEGYTIAFNGTKGRLEHSMVEQIYVSGTDAVQGGIQEGSTTIRIVPMRGAPQDIAPWPPEGSHGGGDRVLLDDLFSPNPAPDKYLRAADERAGACSILVGLAANRCFETKRPVEISDLVQNLESPTYPPMPPRTMPVPMPPQVRFK